LITRTEYDAARKRAALLLEKTGISLQPKDLERIEVADFGLEELEQTGAEILTLVNTEKIAVKLIVLFPNQTLPEHKHPSLGNYPGKEEAIRCEWGVLYLYGPGEPVLEPKGHPPEHRKRTYTMWREEVLVPGDQVIFPPNTLHWFQAGPDGAVCWSYSTKAVDLQDVFSDPEIQRGTVIVDG
jgi:D-lyxose ketol-isomerase